MKCLMDDDPSATSPLAGRVREDVAIYNVDASISRPPIAQSLPASGRGEHRVRCRFCATAPMNGSMGKITGFLEFDRRDRHYEPVDDRIKHWREFVLPLPEEETRDAGRALHGLRHALLPHAAARSTTRSRTGTTSSIRAIGRRRRATCTRPTTSRSSPAASARRRARPPAR